VNIRVVQGPSSSAWNRRISRGKWRFSTGILPVARRPSTERMNNKGPQRGPLATAYELDSFGRVAALTCRRTCSCTSSGRSCWTPRIGSPQSSHALDSAWHVPLQLDEEPRHRPRWAAGSHTPPSRRTAPTGRTRATAARPGIRPTHIRSRRIDGPDIRNRRARRGPDPGPARSGDPHSMSGLCPSRKLVNGHDIFGHGQREQFIPDRGPITILVITHLDILTNSSIHLSAPIK